MTFATVWRNRCVGMWNALLLSTSLCMTLRAWRVQMDVANEISDAIATPMGDGLDDVR